MVGLGVTALMGWWINRVQGSLSSTLGILVGAIGLVVAGILCEGVLVGYAQGRVLRQLFPSLSKPRWIWLTAIGAGFAWLVGMIPSTIASLNASNQIGGNAAPPFEGAMVFVMAAAMGIALGTFLGVPQWFELRRQVSYSGWWVAANSVAWAVGMAIVFIGATPPNEKTPVGVIFLIIPVTCLVAGLVVGAVHGLFLLWLTKWRRVPS